MSAIAKGMHVRAFDKDWTVLIVSTVEPAIYCKEGHPPKWGGRTSSFFTDQIEGVS